MRVVTYVREPVALEAYLVSLPSKRRFKEFENTHLLLRRVMSDIAGNSLDGATKC